MGLVVLLFDNKCGAANSLRGLPKEGRGVPQAFNTLIITLVSEVR